MKKGAGVCLLNRGIYYLNRGLLNRGLGVYSKSRNFESQHLYIVGMHISIHKYLSMLYFLPSIVCGSANFIALNAVGATKNPFTLFSLITLKKFRSKYE